MLSDRLTVPCPEDQAQPIVSAEPVVTEVTHPGLRLRATIDLGCDHRAVDHAQRCVDCGLHLGEFLSRPTVKMRAVNPFATKEIG